MKYLLLLLCTILMTGCIVTSEGSRSGELIKVSKKGLFVTSCEGQLATGIMTSRGSQNGKSSVWEFSSTNLSLCDKLEPLIGQKITVQYADHMFTSPLSVNTGYIITDF